jgi:hypothetical protein
MLFVSACWALGSGAQAADLGRLFYTPQQREDLDRKRASDAVETPEVMIDSQVTVNGHVTRSTGKTTTWLNGVPQYDTPARTRDAARVRVDQGDQTVELKVGQTLDRSRGEVQDGLAGGTVRVPSGR